MPHRGDAIGEIEPIDVAQSRSRTRTTCMRPESRGTLKPHHQGVCTPVRFVSLAFSVTLAATTVACEHDVGVAAGSLEAPRDSFEAIELVAMEDELASTTDPEVRMQIRRDFMRRAHAEAERRSLDDPTSGAFEVRMRDLIMNSEAADADGLATDRAQYGRGERIEATREDLSLAAIEAERLERDHADWSARFHSERRATRYGEVPEVSTDRGRLDAIILEHRDATRRVQSTRSDAAAEAR